MKKLAYSTLVALTLFSCNDSNNRIATPESNPFQEVQVVKTPTLETAQEISKEEFAQSIQVLGQSAGFPAVGYHYQEDQYLVIKTEGNEYIPFIYCHFNILKEKTFVKTDGIDVFQYVRFERKALNKECKDGAIAPTEYIQKDKLTSFTSFDMEQFDNGLDYVFKKGMANRSMSIQIEGNGLNEDNVEVKLRTLLDSSLSLLQPIRFQRYEEVGQLKSTSNTKVLKAQDLARLNLNDLPIMIVNEDGEAVPTGEIYIP